MGMKSPIGKYKLHIYHNNFMKGINNCYANTVICAYSYEIQIESHARSLGLGKHIMMILEALTTRLNLSKVVLTAFKHNPKALGFFKAIG